jgi:hypothetical protein
MCVILTGWLYREAVVPGDAATDGDTTWQSTYEKGSLYAGQARTFGRVHRPRIWRSRVADEASIDGTRNRRHTTESVGQETLDMAT